jgi:hypothetical protein
MRSRVLPASVAVAAVVALTFGGCTDDSSSPDLPIDEEDDEGYRDTMLPAITDPQFTAPPNPDAGRDGAPVPGDPDPAEGTPEFDP